MKRSEMLKLLKNDVNCIRNVLKTEATDEALSIILLKHIEEAGMQPPQYQSDIYLRSECDYAMISEWESEDE